jgi:hypothetical protein
VQASVRSATLLSFLVGLTRSSSIVLGRSVSGVTSTASFLLVPQSRRECARTAAPGGVVSRVFHLWYGIVRYTWEIRIAHHELCSQSVLSVAAGAWLAGLALTVQYTSSSIAMMSRGQRGMLWRSCEWYKGTRAASESTFA